MVESDSDSEEDENVCRLVAETIHFLLPEGEVVVGRTPISAVVGRTRRSLFLRRMGFVRLSAQRRCHRQHLAADEVTISLVEITLFHNLFKDDAVRRSL